MPIIAAYVLPHPPIVVPEVGKGEERKIENTASAFRSVAKEINVFKPDTLVITSPHSIMYADYFHISPGDKAKGDFSRFGVRGAEISVKYDAEFVRCLGKSAAAADISAGSSGEKDKSLDHGALVPLYFVNKEFSDYAVVRAGISGLDPLEHYKFGKLIAAVTEELNRRVVFIASGDLSHKLKNSGPYGFAPEGPEFDKKLTDALSEGDFLKLLTFDPKLSDAAGECGLRSFMIMAGALDGKAVDSALLSYEGTFGVGYAVCAFKVKGSDPERRFDLRFNEINRKVLEDTKGREDTYVRLARQAAEYYVKIGSNLPLPDGLLPEMLSRKAGVFVSCKKRGMLRGCIGTIAPITGSIAEEIIRNARSSVAEDPRFNPVERNELALLTYSVDILEEPEDTEFYALDPEKYGVIVTSGRKRGLLLPNLEGVDTAEKQVEIALQKAGISISEKYTLQRFEVTRHK
ncbi:MAG: AmmeMemoRadiSam system protein A [Deferribacteraceae bacterium]|nr:AmmeMemoRadiSam system protein A [Deferribacteraceae bacterium]